MSGPHALKCYCDGPDEVIDPIWINNQRHPCVIFSSPSFVECSVIVLDVPMNMFL